MAEQVGSDAAAQVRYAVYHSIPQVGVEEDAVNEQRCRAFALIGESDPTRRRIDCMAF
jgi:hypothetical protein